MQHAAEEHTKTIQCGQQPDHQKGDKNLNWKDVQILNDKEGKPSCVIRNGRNKKIDVHISISHVKNYAVANAIITQKT